jgi:hypothetical protein
MGRAGWIPGVPRRPNRGAEMNNKLPLARFPRIRVRTLSRHLVLRPSPLADPAKPARPNELGKPIARLVASQPEPSGHLRASKPTPVGLR